MKDEYQIDGHKLDYHIDRVHDWMNAKEVVPVYVEISPTARCNHNCTFCALDFTNHTTQTINTASLLRIGGELAIAGVRGVMFGGEGEPTLQPDLPSVIKCYQQLGISTALTTNGTGLSQEFAIEGGRELAWLKVSVNGGTEKAYKAVHGVAGLDEVFTKIAQFRAGCGRFTPTLGCQAVAVPDNLSSLPELCQRAIDAGMDYVVIKPFSPNIYSPNSLIMKQLSKLEWCDMIAACHAVCMDKIHLITRNKAFDAVQNEPCYNKCLSVPHFWAYIRSNMDLVACSNHMQDARFVLGNLGEESFESIWYSHKNMKRVELKQLMRSFDISQCRKACRMNAVNEWLWKISQPNAHRNFI